MQQKLTNVWSMETKKNYLVALIVPNKEFLNDKEKINKTIEIVNKKLTLVERIKKIQLIDENFFYRKMVC